MVEDILEVGYDGLTFPLLSTLWVCSRCFKSIHVRHCGNIAAQVLSSVPLHRFAQVAFSATLRPDSFGYLTLGSVTMLKCIQEQGLA